MESKQSTLHPQPIIIPNGRNPVDNIWVYNRRFIRGYIDFITKVLYNRYQPKKNIKVADIGVRNIKAEEIKKQFNWSIQQIQTEDFNYPFIVDGNKFDIILCFETFEHIINQLTFLESIKGLMHEDSILFMSFPSRPSFLWTKYHYHETSKKRFSEWILAPLEMEIIARSKLFIPQPWWFFITGLRPFIRLFYNNTNLYAIRLK